MGYPKFRGRIFFCLTAIGLLLPTILFGQEKALRVMSYNIRHGEGLDNMIDLDRISSIIDKQKVDFCALQEVDKLCKRSGSVDQMAYLASACYLNGFFGSFMEFNSGQYGMANLSADTASSSLALRLPDGLREARVAIIQEFEIPELGSILFVNVHFDWISGLEGTKSRLAQAKALMQYLNASNAAVIVTGDFNCTPDSPTMQFFKENGFVFAKKGPDCMSFQGDKEAEIDHLILRSSAVLTIDLEQIRLLKEPLASDHRPLIAELRISTN